VEERLGFQCLLEEVREVLVAVVVDTLTGGDVEELLDPVNTFLGQRYGRRFRSTS